jgi:hypothetical protein
MTDRPLDHWRDRMIAALYGELSADEMREFEAELEGDEELASDWQELREARASLQHLDHVDAESDVVFGIPPAGQLRQRTATVVPIRRWILASAVGFAAAATVFVALLLVGLRVDRTPAGVLVRFDGSSAGELAAASGVDPQLGTGGVASQGHQYLTRAEFTALAQLLMEATGARLDELERRQSSSQMELTQALYDALALRQQRQYDDLRTQIQLAAYRAAGTNPYGPSERGRTQSTPIMEESPNDIH